MTKVPKSTEKPISIPQQVAMLMKVLKDLPEGKATDTLLKEIIGYVIDLPPSERPDDLEKEIRRVFHLSYDEIRKLLPAAKKTKVDFDSLVPQEGWIYDYLQYTKNTEPPTVFHVFAAMVALGASMERRVYFSRGAAGNIYPNLCVIIVAPSGKCRKTSCCNIAMGLYERAGGMILADKTTPEALVEAYKDSDKACGVIYAPELAVFLGKQKYQEGMVPMLTALFDCPDVWKSATIMRGAAELRNVAFSMVGCSTIDWIQTAIPKDAFGGGFMSRLLWVVQEDTPRSFPIPPEADKTLKNKLVTHLQGLRKIKGQFKMTAEADDWYRSWYSARAFDGIGSKQYAGYFERKPTHVIRIAMILAIAEGKYDLVLSKYDLERANRFLLWVEDWLPDTFDEMNSNMIGEDHTRLLQTLKKAGGFMKHSELLRRNSRRMNKFTFKNAMDTLRDAQLATYSLREKGYYLTSEGWK
jgi:hypothetical protein